MDAKVRKRTDSEEQNVLTAKVEHLSFSPPPAVVDTQVSGWDVEALFAGSTWVAGTRVGTNSVVN